MEKELVKELIAVAKEARQAAYAPYSDFAVGAAALTKQGSIYSGCNIENAAYGLSNCAERTAIFKAISEQEVEIEAVAVVGATAGPCIPCGACLQVMAEFRVGKLQVIMANLKGDVLIKELAELLTTPFAKEDLE
ncbi:cytidine deaminase [Fuchsiella alkaliacetigena]|uniref:cytidine deaminase n=1 Tax=Fuchsiella alkaliacetigena TaxID=957042 RepID=UPI00200B95DA|nr:cytidine deaminase [Fuchsiella alkaliacetigena]MCK8824464.1 cytidine deaminase [Fuchsiella alkaliacetigena]